MHLAGVLADGVLPSLTLESLERSYAPKALGVGGAMWETMGWNETPKIRRIPWWSTLDVEVCLGKLWKIREKTLD